MTPQLPKQVVDLMAQRGWRLHHFLWHEVRNGWLFYDAATQAQIRELGWEPPRPAQRPVGDRGETILDNFSGEDFLYMHREMIGTVNKLLVGNPDYPKVKGWTQLPRPGDADYPVPPPWVTGDDDLDNYLRSVKSDQTFNTSFVTWERNYTDPARLRAMSLGEFGARLEFTIHNQMHMRWCAEPVATGVRPDVDPAAANTIDIKWDAPTYDWLGDTYSSHVHSTFWKLHGWVDDRIDDWAKANDVVGAIPWRGMWLGKSAHPPHTFARLFAMTTTHDHHHHDNLRELHDVVRIIAKTGRFCHFYDDVKLQ